MRRNPNSLKTKYDRLLEATKPLDKAFVSRFTSCDGIVLTGSAAMQAFTEWLLDFNHIHTKRGIVYGSTIANILIAIRDARGGER